MSTVADFVGAVQDVEALTTEDGYTIAQAAELLECANGPIIAWVKRGIIQRFRVSEQRYWLYRKADVERLAQTRHQLDERYYSRDEVLRLLGVSVDRFTQLMQEHQIPSIPIPGRHYFAYLKTAIDALLAERAQVAATRPTVFPDPERFSRLYEELYPRAVRRVTSWLRGDSHTAQDIVQTAMLAAWERGAATFEQFGDEDLLSILHGEVKLAFVNHLRASYAQCRDHRQTAGESIENCRDALRSPEPSVEQQVIDRELLDELQERLKAHPQVVQTVAWLKFLGFRHREVRAYLREQLAVNGLARLDTALKYARQELHTVLESGHYRFADD